MKTLTALIVFAAACVTLSFARSPTGTKVYSTAEAKNHVGELASVVGIVEQVSSSNKGTQFLNFDGKYPDAPFTAVVFKSDASAVGDVKKYEGKRVTVTGKITLYHGTPEIIVRSADALKAEG
jgi:DNA/RNA endonuclease YhcR with UshA esterase domain